MEEFDLTGGIALQLVFGIDLGIDHLLVCFDLYLVCDQLLQGIAAVKKCQLHLIHLFQQVGKVLLVLSSTI